MKACFRVVDLGMAMLLCVALGSCGHSGENGLKIEKDSVEGVGHRVESVGYNYGKEKTAVKIFGVSTKGDEYSVAKALERAGIIQIDTLSMEAGHFQSAIVEFQGVKFGMNRGFSFITSRHDAKTVKALVDGISKFYGEPEVDGDDEDAPEYNYYHWNRLGDRLDDPYIRIRPLHSDEGGLVMTWEF